MLQKARPSIFLRYNLLTRKHNQRNLTCPRLFPPLLSRMLAKTSFKYWIAQKEREQRGVRVGSQQQMSEADQF